MGTTEKEMKEIKKYNSSFKFGDIIENGYASENNPIRTGVFINYGYRNGRCNPGKYLNLTDMNGRFWEYGVDNDKLMKIGNILLQERQRTLEEVLEIMGCTVTDRFISGIDPKDEKLDKIISLYVNLTTK